MPQRTRGLLFAFGAFLLWGLFPLFWQLLRALPAIELSAHRVLWSLLFLGGFLAVAGRGGEFWAVLRKRRVLLWLSFSAALLGVNFVTFIYAVETDRVLEASLGYFINPMINIVLGRLVFGERLRGLEGAAVLFAGLGVLQMCTLSSDFPWLSLLLAGSFSSYGLIRKTARVEALPGTTVEALLLSVPAVLWIAHVEVQGTGHFLAADFRLRALIVLTGAVTAVPLVWFASGARRISLGTLGFLQFIAPTMQFLTAVGIFGEKFGLVQVSSFACIWVGVLLFIVHSARLARAG